MAAIPFVRARARDHAAQLIAGDLGSALDTVGRVTDFNVGSVTRSLFEAIGLRFESLDNGTYQALRDTIPTVLYEFLGPGDGLTTFVGFPKLPAFPTTGVVRFTRTVGTVTAIPIPVGTRLTVPGVGTVPAKIYTTVVPAELGAAATSVDVLVQSDTLGVFGNTPANTVTLTDTIENIDGATNPAAFFNGRPEETDEARRLRFAAWLGNLARAQLAGLEVGARTARLVTAGVVTEQVLAAQALDVPDKLGLVDVFVDNGGGSASPALVIEAQRILDGYRATDGTRVPGYKAGGVEVHVHAVVPEPVPVTCAIAMDGGFAFAAVQPAVTAAITALLAGLPVFSELVRAELVCAILGVRGIRDVTVTAPATNVVAAYGARLLPGPIVVQEAA